MTNYRRGVAYEYEVIRLLEADGYEVMRSAGSHTPWDIHAHKKVRGGKHRDLYIAIYCQCKTRKP